MNLKVETLEVELLDESHLYPVKHKTSYIQEAVNNNTRFIYIEKAGDKYFHMLGFKLDNVVYLYKTSFESEKLNYVDYFCKTYNIDLGEDEVRFFYDSLIDSEIIIAHDEIVGERFQYITELFC